MTSVCGNVCLCLFSQNCIATHESNGIDIITALILNDINPLGKKRMDLVLELKASQEALLLTNEETEVQGEKLKSFMKIMYRSNSKVFC